MVLDTDMRFIGWSPEAEKMLGYRPAEVLGQPAGLILGAPTGTRPRITGDSLPQKPVVCSVRHRSGDQVSVALSASPLSHSKDGAAWCVTVTDAELLHRQSVEHAMLTGIKSQSPLLLILYDTSGRVRWFNSATEKQFGMTLAECCGRYASDLVPEGRLFNEDGLLPMAVEEIVQQVVRTGEPAVDLRYEARTRLVPSRQEAWSCSFFRLQDDSGEPVGVCETSVNVTDRHLAQQRLALLSRASGSIVRSLDIRHTAGYLVELVVPEFADVATVDLLEPVLNGHEPEPVPGRNVPPVLRRVAPPSDPTALGNVEADGLAAERLSCLRDAAAVADPAAGTLIVPLQARGVVLGVATFVRDESRTPFDREEIALADELVSRTAICVDNVRRYVLERATALTLQHDLLPRALLPPHGIEVGYRYLPAAGPVGVGGDWYDLIPLSGTRVGLVVGDVVGHGMRAAATMGRLRTTVAALAALDLAPDELLARLDNVVTRVGNPQPTDFEDEDQALGVTCLYAIYDPISRHCVMARAGHVPPVLATADGNAELVDLPAGPPLGVGGLPFESTDIELPERSVLALFTDGLVENRTEDIDAGIHALCGALSRPVDGPLDETCDAVVRTLLPQAPEDDAALMLIRADALAEDLVATWDLDTEAGEVARARSLAGDQLLEWGIDEAARFVAELVVSELVTNAIRYGGAPVRLRLIRMHSLIIEVSDGGLTSPHLRQAAAEDEGGRGLFLVAQLTQRWGTRYSPPGKTIWTEVSANGAEGAEHLRG
ncbi:SpoIIE family protein phosphatase [Streptomyces spinoverrucosus]|uniref:SpoIIE family protein phosphatase n=1 Tax=Streptomyces spinoverrucosus TaxID=284043 RepID=UPI0018C378FC|nr:SpoIIE family protein phosphatase [Streptomyces spinoverrucosus]MBG0850365.1 SpoIIE family protein phosphatase [Streptomyces spinoverrucosus]